jgi:integrase
VTDLEPITPQDAVDWYLDDRKNELSYASKQNIEQGLDNFLSWASEDDLDNMNDFTRRKARRFKTWRQDQEGANKVSLNGNLAVVRRFTVFCVDIEAVKEGVPNKVPSSIVSEDEEVRKDPPSDEHVSAVREYLCTYRPASRVHAEHETTAELGIRTGSVRAIDIPDFKPKKKAIILRHRPEETGIRGTPLKNGSDGERSINISGDLRDLLVAYVNNSDRPEGTDKFGRRPLFTSVDSDGTVGRIGVSRVRDDFYKVSRPCEIGESCPIDRDPGDCQAAKNPTPTSVRRTTHPIRFAAGQSCASWIRGSGGAP